MAVFRSFKSCIQTQASATLARAVLDGSFDGLAMNKAWRRQSSAEWAARAIADNLAEGKVWSTGWRQLRAHNDGAFRDAVEEAAALHSRDDLFARHIAPDPAEEGPPMWAMAEDTDDEGADDAPMPDAPPEPELVDVPTPLRHPHLACRTWSAASLCGSCMPLVHDESCKKNMSHMTIVTCVLFSCAVVFVLCVFVLCVLPWIPLLQKKSFFGGFWGGGESDCLKWCPQQGDFCAVL